MGKEFRGRTSKNRKTGKPQTKKDHNPKNTEEGTSVNMKYNDASWYALNDQLMRDTASLSFNTVTGIPFDMNHYKYGKDYFPEVSTVPGIMEIETVLMPGVAQSPSSPINVASRNLYSYIRHSNSGSANYDSPNLMMYILAMDSIYAFYNNLKRLYGVLNTYSLYNRYLPEAIVQAMGFNFSDFLSHIVDLRAFLNTTCGKINTRCVPDTMSYIVRHSWMFSNIYKDEDSEQAQMYVFKQANLYQYDEMSEPAKLSYQGLVNRAITFNEAMTIMNTALAKIIESQDFAIMSGDILKAFGENRLFRVSQVPDDYTVVPVYNPEVLNQIHNATPLGRLAAGMDIYEDVNTLSLVQSPIVTTGVYGHLGNKILDMYDKSTDPANVLVATRLMAFVSDEYFEEASGDIEGTLSVVGSEYVAGMTVWTYGTNTTTGARQLSVLSTDAGIRNAGITNANIVRSCALGSKFRAKPLAYWYTYPSVDAATVDPTVIQFCGITGEVGVYTILSKDVVERMHTTALMSEFGITMV